MNRYYYCSSIFIAMLVASILATSCGGNGQKSGTSDKPREFTLPTIPSIYTHPVERADYLAGHYWDNFDFSDTSLILLPEIGEQAFVNYIDIFPHVTEGALRSSVNKTLDRAQVSPQMFTHFTGLFEKYLYDPNSPARNEAYYRLVLEYLIGSPQVDSLNKIRPQFLLIQVNKNRPGIIATDFVYTLANGKQESMRRIKSEYLILFFHNPGCSACAEYQQWLERSPVFQQMEGTGKLKILAMYVDADIDAWRAHRSDFPTSWINGYDASTTIRNNNLYDLRAIPSLYLLDREKKVLLKDATPNQVEERLLSFLQNAQ